MNGALLSSLQNGLLGGKYGKWKKAFLVLLMAALLVSTWGGITRVDAASVGDQLTAPEAGWQRYDDHDSFITYHGSPVNQGSGQGLYNDTGYAIYGTDSVEFTFVGTKMRFIGANHLSRSNSNNLEVYLDGVLHGAFSQYGPTFTQVINYEITNLSNSEHVVEIFTNDGAALAIDAIDIDDTGSLVDPNAPTIDAPLNLQAAAGNAQVNLSWDAVTGADTYNVQRSTTQGGPYSVIDSVYGTTYNDTGVVNGTTYYYVVTAVNTSGESAQSNEASATPQAPPAAAGQALLVVTLVSGLEKEYDLTATEVNAFIDWYDNRAAGTGPERYEIAKGYNQGPFTSRKDNLVFDKIMTFEVMEYNAVQ